MLQIRAFAALAACCAAGVALAQQAPPEEPGWAKGRPKTDTAMKMAPVPAFPIPTPADQLPTKKLKVPPGFKVETWASGVLDAREIREGPKGTIVVSTLFVGNKVYAVPPGKHEPKVIIDKMPMATGIAFDSKGNLYVGTNTKFYRYDNVEAKLDNVGEGKVIYDKLPGGNDHSWKFFRIKDDKLYFNIGAPCNICDPGDYAKIYRMNLDGTNVETLAQGVRNTVGFDFDPKTGDLWFTDNGRDWLGDDQPPDELNHLTKVGEHFGFPFCHGHGLRDPEFNARRACSDFTPPARELGPHVASLGMRFYTGRMFPEKYRGGIFIAEHGSWNRSTPIGYRVTFVKIENGRATSYEPFAAGWLKGSTASGRPADVLVMPDGALLVSDDKAGRIYRISYGNSG